MTSDYRAALALINREGILLGLGESLQMSCPFCQAPHERKFYIKRVEVGYLYHCFRASCGKHGISGAGLPTGAASNKSKVRAFKGNLVQLPEEVYQLRYSKYQVTYDQLIAQGVRYADEIKRVYVPLFDHRGFQIAEDLRSWEDKPKAIIYPWSDTVPLVHFPLGQSFSPYLTVVEDYLSAIKCSSIVYSCSITGTHISREGIELLLSIGIKKLSVMLDGDAMQKAVELFEELSPFFECRIVQIPKEKDPKDLSYQNIEELLCQKE